ncbi:MAG: transcriptional regulator, partial [Pararhizobium sp.]
YLNPLPIKEIHDRWIGPYAAQAVDLLGRLKGDLEG